MKKLNIGSCRFFLALLSGFLLTCSFPNINGSFVVWFALAPLLVSISNVSPAKGFILGFLTGFFHYLSLLYWVVYTTKVYGHLPAIFCGFALLIVSAYLACYFAVFSAAFVKICKKPWIMLVAGPGMWVSLEYLRSVFLTGFPWELIGYSQYLRLVIIQISDITGVYGVSFLIVFVNITLFVLILFFSGKKWQKIEVSVRFTLVSAAVCVVLFCVVCIYGKWRIQYVSLTADASETACFTIVQGNIDQATKWNKFFQKSTVKKYNDLSLEAIKYRPDLVVWPETAMPFFFQHNKDLSEKVIQGIKKTGSDCLFGAPFFSSKGRLSENNIKYYNSAYLLDSDGKIEGRYDKVHLVPFGEYVPLKKWLPFFGKLVANVGDFNSGSKGATIKWGDKRLGVQICYEIIFPELSCSLTRNNAVAIVNITNDAWFGKTSAPFQHFSMVVFRAVENRRSIIRSANTGKSGFVDPVGRVLSSTNLCEKAVVTRLMPLLDMLSFYSRYGDLFVFVCMIITFFCAVYGVKK